MKQLPFFRKTIKPIIKELTNAKLLSESLLFEKPIRTKIKKLSTIKLLSKQPFYKQPTKNPSIKKLSNFELLRKLPFYETCQVEIINNKSLSDSLSLSKSSVKNLFMNY